MDIQKWKQKYGKIYRVVINGGTYIYRQLTIGECSVIYPLIESGQDAEDEILKAVLYPENFDPDKVLLGITSALTTYILKSSKIFDQDIFVKYVNEVRNRVKSLMSNPFYVWKMAIIQNLPGYTFEDLDKLNIDKFFELVCLCEEIGKQQLIAVPQGPPVRQSSQVAQQANPELRGKQFRREYPGKMDKRAMLEESANIAAQELAAELAKAKGAQ